MKNQCFSLWSLLLITSQLMVNLFDFIHGNPNCEILTSGGIIEGQATQLVCVLTTDEELVNMKHISWSRKNLQTGNVDQMPILRHKVVKSEKLKIDPVNREDGQYQYICKYEYKNKNIECVTTTASLSIKKTPRERYPECIIPDKSYQEGDVITISCHTEFLSNTVHLNISKGNRPIQGLKYNIIGNERVLKYKFCVTANNNDDSFVCTQTSNNVPGEEKQCKFPPLNVNYVPRVKISYSGKTHVQLGIEALLACTADSNPIPYQYIWDSTPYIAKFKLETNGLVYRTTVDNLSLNGTIITCKVTNKVGTGENNYTLIVVDNNEQHKPTKADKPIISNTSNLNRGVTDDSEIKLLTIAGATLFLSALLIFILFCYLRQRHILYMQNHYIAQPEVYFEPKDSVRTQPPTSEGPYWGRNVGIQVPPDPDKDSEYAEIEEARKSGSNKSV
ncbi:uncharacterized protein LOC117116923 [Anneissia japonica]|uniref:uncharacterized protein LOC117116923 n=1 Tax=Anneissia japonica TaxID=1529436 RepID=UPI0014258F72|nr:uncharacterized protein LOC117116923 [Anneissia japonica]XP_033116954.1 uncharacterized protein LOC117116923 [Anneissia japonica]